MDVNEIQTPAGVLKALFHHIALPAKLPQSSASNTEDVERAILDRLVIAIKLMQNVMEGPLWQTWDSIRRSLLSCKTINIGGKLERTQLASRLRQLRDSDLVILHLGAQNAGLLVYKPVNPEFHGNILFEAFEASPRREPVLASQTLSWTFPGTAVLVPSSVFYNDAFIESLSGFLEQASVEHTQKFSEYGIKAGRAVAEERGTPDPALITSLLTAILEANGRRISPTLLRKRVRDDVCWFSSVPWRRLPYWLVLRVGISRYLAMVLGGAHGRIHFKFMMCIIHSMVLNDTRDTIPLEDQAFLKTKLCRRLFKLDRDSLEQPQAVQESYFLLNRALTPWFKRIIGATTTRINTAWEHEKLNMIRPILPLPRKAPRQAQRLSLVASRSYLTNARKRFQDAVPRMAPPTRTTPQQPKVHIQAFGSRLFALFSKEEQLHVVSTNISTSSLSLSTQVRQLHKHILDYIDQIGGCYENNVEQKSIMLLTLLETWMSLDKVACSMFPLLNDFHPAFTSRLIEVLRFPLLSDMARARKVESYIQDRISQSKTRATLFDDPCKGCFAERYFNESPGSAALGNLLAEIQLASLKMKEEKEKEWKELSAEYEQLTREYESSTCIYVQPLAGLQLVHDLSSCRKCQLEKSRSRMVIKAFESLLPENPVMAKVVIFELRCPEALAQYRDATWAILYRIARQTQEPGVKPKLCLQDYSGLQLYEKVPGHITLASTTKSFLMTHYREQKRFPVELDQVCLPNGLKFAYFDTATGSWPGRREIHPTFEHHCKLTLPKGSPFSSLLQSQSFNSYGNGPTSYEIAASHSSCPSSLSIHEHMAFQFLLSGKRRRWLSLLTELGSSNLNLSTETTVLLFDHLAHQIGPSEEGEAILGAIHYIFRDASFCEKLIQQLQTRLEAIATNWRETHLMEIVIILALRIIAFTAPFIDTNHLAKTAQDLLLEARQITFQWIRMLRKEMYCASNLSNAQNCQSYLLWAALLCKRTFASLQMTETGSLDEDELSTFLECSSTVYDNIPEDISSLGQIVQNSFVRDLRMMYDLKDQIRLSIEAHGQSALLTTLQVLWPAAESKYIYNVTFEADNWIQVELVGYDGVEMASYNYFFGILLVNGQPLGRLPTDPESTIILEELFGSQTSLMKFPSSSPGMTHVLAFKKEGYHTHIGYDGRDTIIRAIKGSQVLELIPRKVFRNGTSFDLPAHLIDNCIHWLDLVSGILEIRPKSKNFWREHKHNWKLDISTSICTRFTPKRFKETLVDPYSPIFIRVSKTFAWFEHAMHLTIYQPSGKYALIVEMPRMQLKWFVNSNNLLQSSHLQAEIDPCQSIDTWYGFDSKLVCRSLKDPLERFVLVPLGSLRARRRGCHVQVCVQLHNLSTAVYLRFMINKTLGRIESAAEPALVYKRAEIHAFTSFILPDPLTGLTGVESALGILTSGISQPWSPLIVAPTICILRSISSLSPVREYYPTDLNVMKKETWDDMLPTMIQRDEFRILVSQIISQSNRLAAFYPQKTEYLQGSEMPEIPSSGDHGLNLRSLHRRRLYERRSNYELPLDRPEDTVYEARHNPHATSLRYSNVLEALNIIRDKPMTMATVENLPLALSQSLHIKGYYQILENITLQERLNIDIRREWGPLVGMVKKMPDQYRLMFFMGIISFRSDANIPLIKTLIAFSYWDGLQSLALPDHAEYRSFRPRQTPQLEILVKLIEPFQVPPPEDPPLVEFASSKDQRKLWQAKTAHIRKAKEDCEKLGKNLISKWPSLAPSADIDNIALVNIPVALEGLKPEWERLYHNHEFYNHLQEVQMILRQRHSDLRFQRAEFIPSEMTHTIQLPGYALPELGNDLIKMPISKIRRGPESYPNAFRGHTMQLEAPSYGPRQNPGASGELDQIIETFSKSKSTIQRRYARDLKESLNSFYTLRTQTIPPSYNEYSLSYFQDSVKAHLAEIKLAIEQRSDAYSSRQIWWLQQGQLWPAVTPITILEQLRTTARRLFGSGMKEKLLDFALSITHLQRKMRMQSYQRSKENARYEEERLNLGHRNWRVEEYPDWLLLEVESNLLIRETQVKVALAIIAPESQENSVLQLNMGQGKTSCIIPMVAALLADGKNLVRVSVPKALLHQTAQLLHGRLGGLVGREISHVPFSRKTPTKEDHIKLFQRLHRDIQRKRGVMLCLPEHQMSFMLSGLQRVLDQRIPEASMMIRVQRWLQSCARDVLDESDHTLAVKTQLIYPSGSQMSVDGHPYRWLVIEQILALTDMHLYDLAISFPHSIEVVRRSHVGFPFVFFLRPDVEEEMIKRLKFDVCRGTRGILPIDTLNAADRLAIKEFLSGGKVRPSSLERISHLCPDRPHIRQTVYLLRGLFVHRILIMALKKRYGVQYGLHPFRDPVAVPFHAKGVPSEQSEFGHVDVAILLTALAFYYRGIHPLQARQALEAVLKSDDPASEYDKWTEDENFPDYLRDWHSINVDDSQQMSQIWNCVRFKVPVIDYFMNNFVFPPHAKQFRVRLQSNGWDIPLFSNVQSDKSAKNTSLSKSRGLTTGFSGTNDIKSLLPLTIRQDDLPALSHTNAEVLTYLLQQRSRRYVVMADQNQKRLSEIAFLQMLKKFDNGIRILIDSGAQILEQSNKELAENWLKIDGRAAAALYFDGDSPFILSKQNTRTPLLASPYADNLNEVLVYLDEAHTRGTDLKFGPRASAALTLGLGQTKDHTVQAAMRLRQLGTTQSVIFFAPPEVNQSIRDLCGKKESQRVDSYDVIRWLINNTCDGIEQLQPLFYSQGTDFCNRMQAAEDFPNFLVNDEDRTAFIDAIKHKERQTLQQLYGIQPRVKGNTSTKSNAKIARFAKELEFQKKNFQDSGQAVHASALQEVEQERETEIEVETVRQVKKPLPYTPLKFPGLHRDLETFARTARIPAGSDCFNHIMKALSRTALGRKYKVNHGASSSPLFVSSEFERTVRLGFEGANDNFLRPVQWILYATSPEAAVIITPEEAEHLLEIIQAAEKTKRRVSTHLITYAAPVTRRMMHFNKLRFYSMPPLPPDWLPSEWLTTELGFFAGRLYFEFSEYDSICRMLGIDLSQSGIDEFDSSETDTTEQYSTSTLEKSSEVTSQNSEESQEISQIPSDVAQSKSKNFAPTLTSKPYTFTQEYLAARRRGQDFTHTPMGFLSSGKPLTHESPFFRRADTIRRNHNLVPVGTAQPDDEDGEGAEDMMDLGNYDPSAEVDDDEEQITIEYDESELHPVAEEDDSGTETQPSGRGGGQRPAIRSKRSGSTAS
ncbi:uncharacterized protein F4812DRAFT_328213 [Daldinia caldariorum]|uniref:uncharacterized protein n=1 Tax=Daldinia caldariorum TaxID=326644 RepID=UPI0020074A1A|nr:uncharacterized protein F4812DRAFT_328213 [Daldinia caldariorum]KAI1469407.1 hypothetical protein F4812DRAFT_328213 [Daldinia caldariorum]